MKAPLYTTPLQEVLPRDGRHAVGPHRRRRAARGRRAAQARGERGRGRGAHARSELLHLPRRRTAARREIALITTR